MKCCLWTGVLAAALGGGCALTEKEGRMLHRPVLPVKGSEVPAAGTSVKDPGHRPPLPPGGLLDRGWHDWKAYSASGLESAGRIEFKRGTLVISSGEPYSGVSIKTPFPRTNYEVSLEARRTEGNDIFCGIYFPVGADACSMILGGWGNYLSGLSMVDGMAASENDTAVHGAFRNDEWVHVRLRVSETAISVWTGETRIIFLEYELHRIEPYPGLEVFEPFGLFTYHSSAEIRNLRVQLIQPGMDTDRRRLD